MKNSKDILKEPAFVLCLERHKDVRYFPTKERLNKAGFKNVYPFSGIDGAGIVDGLKSGDLDCFDEGLLEAAEYLFDVKINNAEGRTYIAPGQFGVFASFLSLWRLIASSNVSGAFIFEDDALPRPDFTEIFPEYWDALDGDEDMVFIGNGSISNSLKHQAEMYRLYKEGKFFNGPVDCLHAVYITRKGAKKLLDMYIKLVDYDKEDELLKEHINGCGWTNGISNMMWADICDYDIKNLIECGCNHGVKYNVNEEKYLQLGKDPKKFINKQKNLFYNHKPRLSPMLYTADNFITFIKSQSKKKDGEESPFRGWATLRNYFDAHCLDFKSVSICGIGKPVSGEYAEGEIPWGYAAGLNSERDSGIIHQNAYQQSSIHSTKLIDELSYIKKSEEEKIPASHIFLIGMDRCGANNILELLGTSVPVSIDPTGRLASKMAFNFFNGFDILEDIENEDVKRCWAYGNMEAIFLAGDKKLGGNHQREIPLSIYRLFKELYYQYPNAKFIYNTRNVDQWVEARRKIGDGYIMDYFQRCSNPHLVGTDKWVEKTKEEVKKYWKESFEKHRNDVLSFFEDKHDDRFIEFNISTDHPHKIIGFLPELKLNINNAWEIRKKWGPHSK